MSCFSTILPKFHREPLPSAPEADWQEKGSDFCLHLLRVAGRGRIWHYQDHLLTAPSLQQRSHNIALRILTGLAAVITLPLTIIGILLLKCSKSYSDALQKIHEVASPVDLTHEQESKSWTEAVQNFCAYIESFTGSVHSNDLEKMAAIAAQKMKVCLSTLQPPTQSGNPGKLRQPVAEALNTLPGISGEDKIGIKVRFQRALLQCASSGYSHLEVNVITKYPEAYGCLLLSAMKVDDMTIMGVFQDLEKFAKEQPDLVRQFFQLLPQKDISIHMNAIMVSAFPPILSMYDNSQEFVLLFCFFYQQVDHPKRQELFKYLWANFDHNVELRFHDYFTDPENPPRYPLIETIGDVDCAFAALSEYINDPDLPSIREKLADINKFIDDLAKRANLNVTESQISNVRDQYAAAL